MIGIVIVAHGGLASEYVSAVEHIIGQQSQLCAVGIGPDHDRAGKQAEICQMADAVDTGQGVVIVTDIFGGTPSNLALMAGSKENRAIIYGVNLPMLIKLLKCRQMPMPDAIAAACETGRRYINCLEPHSETSCPPSDQAAVPAPLAPCATQLIRPVANRTKPHSKSVRHYNPHPKNSAGKTTR